MTQTTWCKFSGKSPSSGHKTTLNNSETEKVTSYNNLVIPNSWNLRPESRWGSHHQPTARPITQPPHHSRPQRLEPWAKGKQRTFLMWAQSGKVSHNSGHFPGSYRDEGLWGSYCLHRHFRHNWRVHAKPSGRGQLDPACCSALLSS